MKIKITIEAAVSGEARVAILIFSCGGKPFIGYHVRYGDLRNADIPASPEYNEIFTYLL